MSTYLDDYFDDEVCDKIFTYLKVSGYQLSISNGVFHLFYSFGDYNFTFTFFSKEAFKSWLFDK